MGLSCGPELAITALAEKERAMIATRTRDALQRAKVRGLKHPWQPKNFGSLLASVPGMA
jgi:DNA invertase Pin-like site-specific DNA recombinase